MPARLKEAGIEYGKGGSKSRKTKKSLKKAQENIPGMHFDPRSVTPGGGPPTRPPVNSALTPANPEFNQKTNWGPKTDFIPGPPPPPPSNVILDGPTPPPNNPIKREPIFTRGGQRVPGMFKHGGMHDGMDSIKPVRGISHKSFKNK